MTQLQPISSILKTTSHQIFVHIILTVYLSFIWSMSIVVPAVSLPVPAACLLMVFTVTPSAAAVFSIVNKTSDGVRYKFGNFIKEFFRLYRKSFSFGLILTGALLIPITQWWYYLEINGSYLVFVFSVFQTYLCLTFLASQVYTLPFLVADNLKLLQAMNKSIRCFLEHIWYSIGLFIQIVSVSLLLGITVMGFVLMFMGILAFFVLNSAKNAAAVNPSNKSAGITVLQKEQTNG